MSTPAGDVDVVKNELPLPELNPQPPARATRPGRRAAQLAFALPSLPAPMPTRRPTRKKFPPGCTRDRAQWWFAQMRRVVAEGQDFDAPGVF